MLSQESIRRITDLLLDQRLELVREIGVLEEDLQALASQTVSDREERGQEASQTRLLERMDEHTRRRLAEIDEALTRIARDEYGVCERCSRDIARARLEAVPAVRDCGPCAAAAEAAGGAAPSFRR